MIQDKAKGRSMKKLGWLPDAIRDPLVRWKRQHQHSKLERLQRSELKHQLQKHSIKKVIVGSSNTKFDGWVSTNKINLNLLNETDWLRYFKRDPIDAILAEHVWEHLTPDQALIAAAQCFKFLKPGGYLRVAVPDGNHNDPSYIEWVRPGGNGPGSDDHRVLYTHETFSQLFSSVGFEVNLLEYFDNQGEFHSTDWDTEAGMIQRSKMFDKQLFDRSKSGGNFEFTSIILDARKPQK